MMGKKEASRVFLSNRITGHHDLTSQEIRSFRTLIYSNYRKNPRRLPWRKTRNPYRIVVSEIMLQQTQVERVLKKYKLFVKTFPDFSSLAEASLRDILTVWQGLGYNRRAISLKNMATSVMTKFGGKIPSSEEALIKLPGIGRYTSAAILTFAYNEPLVLIETNIRTVYIYFFFRKKTRVEDTEIVPLIEKTIDRKNPREWYYALMDYGMLLKKAHPNVNRKSAHYQRQTPFHGSNRQIRGMILKLLVEKPGLSQKELVMKLGLRPEMIKRNLRELQEEGFLKNTRRRYTIA